MLKELLKALGRAFRGPLPQPSPKPLPLPRPQPSPQPTPRPTPQPKPQPQPQPKPRPVPETEPLAQPSPETEVEPEDQTEPQSETEEEDEECEDCPDCPPRNQGASVIRNYGAATGGSLKGYYYQNFVCPWHTHNPGANQIEEWNFSGVDFDGLHPSVCHLFEAKHGYNGFLKETYGQVGESGLGTIPELADWVRNSNADPFKAMLSQGRNQHSVVAPHFGEVTLTWVFSHMLTRLYMGRLFLKEINGWYHEMQVRPFD